MLNRSEYKERLSRRGQNGARVRWENYHKDLLPKTYPPDLPNDCFKITIENLITKKTHVLTFHPGSRRGRFRIDVDGVFWRECGFSDALARIRKSCKLQPLYTYDL
jgi:hypothetical protein